MKYRNNLKGSLAYRSYLPTLLSGYAITFSPALTKALDEARASFEELNRRLHDIGGDTLRTLMADEARASFRLSETRPRPCFSFGLAPGLGTDAENILRATDYGIDALTSLPISTRLIKNIHYLVCASPAYDKKYRGELRKSPVWIGEPGAGIDTAIFIPPVDPDMTTALADLDNFIHYSTLPPLVKAAMIHYQFEMIHPFIDANGRVGRILNTLFLCDTALLARPVLQLSATLSLGYTHYTDAIQLTNQTADMEQWLLYFLPILSEAARLTAASSLNH